MSNPESPLPISSTAEAPPLAAAKFPLWGLKEVLLVVVFGAVALFACTGIALLVAGYLSHGRLLRPDQAASNPLVVLPPQIAAYALTFVFVYRMLVRHFRTPFLEGIGWQWPRAWAAFPLGGVVLAALVLMISAFLPSPSNLPIEQFYRTYLGAWMMVGFGVLIAPLAEELLFRGLLFPALEARIGGVLGTLLTALAFALLHASQLGRAWAPLLMLFLVGVVLTVVRWRARSLAASVLMHMGYNAAMVAELFWSTRGFHNLGGR